MNTDNVLKMVTKKMGENIALKIDKELKLNGEKVGISKEILPNGQVRYRHREAENVPGVWVSAIEALGILEKQHYMFSFTGSIPASYGYTSEDYNYNF